MIFTIVDEVVNVLRIKVHSTVFISQSDTIYGICAYKHAYVD